MKIETGYVLELDTKALTESGEFSGYASVFNNEDFAKDVVLPGAFSKSLKQRPAAKVKMLRGHDQSEPIGVWLDLVEDQKGLRAKGQLILDTTKGRETYALMKAGALDGLSIGYRTIKARYDRAKSIRYIDAADLPEISVVTFPMNPRATVSAVKGGLADKTSHERERAIVAAIKRATVALSS